MHKILLIIGFLLVAIAITGALDVNLINENQSLWVVNIFFSIVIGYGLAVLYWFCFEYHKLS